MFDTDHPRGDIAHRYGDQAQIIDLSRTIDQMHLFDTMIAEPGNNYVVDLQASLLDKFFTIYHDIAFDEGATQAGISVAVFFILDRTLDSIHAARAVRQKLRASEFITVINEAIGSPLVLPGGEDAIRHLARDREVTLPVLSAASRQIIEQPGFSFSDFIVGEIDNVPKAIYFELWQFLETIYNQRVVGASGSAMLI